MSSELEIKFDHHLETHAGNKVYVEIKKVNIINRFEETFTPLLVSTTTDPNRFYNKQWIRIFEDKDLAYYDEKLNKINPEVIGNISVSNNTNLFGNLNVST